MYTKTLLNRKIEVVRIIAKFSDGTSGNPCSALGSNTFLYEFGGQVTNMHSCCGLQKYLYWHTASSITSNK